MVELSPSWPPPLSPQHLTPPAVVKAQEWLFPEAIWTMSVSGAKAKAPGERKRRKRKRPAEGTAARRASAIERNVMAVERNP